MNKTIIDRGNAKVLAKLLDFRMEVLTGQLFAGLHDVWTWSSVRVTCCSLRDDFTFELARVK